MIKVFYAEHGTKADLLATLDAIEDQARLELDELAAMARTALDAPVDPYADRVHVRALTIPFHAEHAKLVLRWVRDVRREVENWPGTSLTEPARRRALRMLETVARTS
jgi:hypothetical protein